MNPKCEMCEPQTVVLAFAGTDGATIAHQLQPDGSIIIGRDERCGMRINADSISAKHCVVRLAEGVVTVMDWYSESGTFVNDQRITEETRLENGDALRLGNHLIQIIWKRPHSTLGAIVENSSSLAKPRSSAEAVDASIDGSETARDDNSGSSPYSQALAIPDPIVIPDFDENSRHHCDGPSNARLQIELAQAKDDVIFLRQELESQLQTALSVATPTAEPEFVSPASDEIEMLRAEVIQLQSELAEREEALLSGWGATTNPIESSETVDSESLVQRLEQLLDELQSADRRVTVLQDLLRSSADEHRAEIEEREQLEKWVAEIEKRVAEREESWNAERTRLESRITEQVAHRKLADKSLSDAIQSSGNGQSERMVVELQSKYDKALDRLDNAYEEVARLKNIVEKANESIEQAQRIRELEDLLRDARSKSPKSGHR